jgi:hypothetical protein
VSTASSDCDGPFYRDYVVGISDEERAAHVAADGVNDFTDITFRERVLVSIVSLTGGTGTLMVHSEPGEFASSVEWHQQTEEGYASGEARFCDDESCDPHAESQRDVYAEQMGY